MERIAVIDYGMGNLRSVAKALEHVAEGQEVVVTGDPPTIAGAARVVFPGQGAMRDCMAEINKLGLAPIILEAASTRPFLGICMGMQVLMPMSEEDPVSPGLALFAGKVERFPPPDPKAPLPLKIPHMGWNNVRLSKPHALWNGIEPDTRFYFVHSYHVSPEDSSLVAATTDYGVEFVCAIARDNLFAVQFHPEKSAHAGLRLLKNFLTWNYKKGSE